MNKKSLLYTTFLALLDDYINIVRVAKINPDPDELRQRWFDKLKKKPENNQTDNYTQD